MKKTIAEIYTKKVRSVSPDTPLTDIRKLLRELDIHHLPVLDKHALVGIISDRDFMKTVSPYAGTVAETARDAATLNKRAHQIMTRHPEVVKLVDTISVAAAKMLDVGVSSLPVLDEHDKFAGIITWKDLVRLLVDEEET